MFLNPQYYKRGDFWNTTSERVPYMFDPPQFGKYMSRNRFNDMTSCFKLRRGSPPPYRDKCWEIRQMQEAFNDHMKGCFNAAWDVCLDESMVKWLNEFSRGWMAEGRKPSPFGNEYHTMACAVLHVIFWIENRSSVHPYMSTIMENYVALFCEQLSLSKGQTGL
jgi:hypothetical protein